MVKRDYVLMKRGARLIEEGKHLKTIPVALLPVALREKFVENPSHKRLTPMERFRLMEALFKMKINIENPYLYRLIKNKSVKKAIIEINQKNEKRYVFVYDKIRVNVPESLFWMCPIPATEARSIW